MQPHTAQNAFSGYIGPGNAFSAEFGNYQPYLRADLGTSYNISRVVITSRAAYILPVENYVIRLGNSAVHGTNPIFGYIRGPINQLGKAIELKQDPPRLGRYIEIRRTQKNVWFSFTQIEIFKV